MSRVLVIKEEHLAALFDEWLKRWEEDPERDDGYGEDHGAASAAYTFELAEEMGYVSY